MADIFISYSRKDREFVVRLNQALQKREYDVWVDLEDIPPTADWMEEVRSGIEGSDAYVLVISPDSIVSKVCQEELAHAVEHNKRLVPIVCREVDPDTVSEPLRSRNWIFFRDGGAAFDEGFQELVDAFSTDLDWLHEHTRLLTRAIEWDKSGRDSSFALRGSDLRTAEEWQARATEKEPKLTPLQTEYILASRKTATRRQRITLGAVTFGLIVALVLGLVAVWQWTAAERQAKIALGRQLAAQAQLKANQGPQYVQQGVLFAVEAENQSPLPSLEAEQILRKGLTLLPRPVAGFTYEDKVETTELTYGASSRMGKVVFSPDGEYVAATNAGKTARVWDLESGEEFTTVTHGGEIQDIAIGRDGKLLATAGADKSVKVWNTTSGEEISRLNHGDRVGYVLFSPDGEHVATASADNTVRLWDPESGEEIARTEQDQSALGIAFSPDGEYLAIAVPTAVRLWDPESGEEMARLGLQGGSPTSMAISPNGEFLAAASGFSAGSGGHVWNLASGEEVARISPQMAIADVAFSPDSRYVATGNGDRTARIWSVDGGEEIASVDHGDLVTGVDFSPDGRFLATASYDNTARVWDLFNGNEEIARMVHDDTMKEAVFSPDGKFLATASADNTVRVWDPYSTREFVDMVHEDARTFAVSGDGKYLATTAGVDGSVRVWDPESGEEAASMTHGVNVLDTAFSPDGSYLATVGVDNTVRVWEPESGEEIASMPHGDLVASVAFDPDGERLATVGLEATVHFWDPENGEEIGRLIPEGPVEGGSVGSGSDYLAFSPDGRSLASVSGNAVRVWDLESGEETARVPHEASVNDVTFSPDGEYLATAGYDKTAQVWDPRSGQEIARMTHESNVLDLEFSPGGKYLATASADATARVWDPESGEEVARMTQEMLVSKVAFSPDGKYLATASADATARVWDPESGSEVMRIAHGPNDLMLGVAFDPAGDYLATVGRLSTRAWPWRRSEDLADEACRRLTRNFTKTEWQQNLPEEEYHETCPGLPGTASLGASELRDRVGSRQPAGYPGNALTPQAGTAPDQRTSQNAEAPVEQPTGSGSTPAAGNRGEDVSGPSSGYNRIETPDGSLAAEVPQSWGVETGEGSEKEGGPNTWSFHAGEYLAASITTAPNLDAWYSTGTSGAYFVASRALAQRYTDYELTNSLFNAPKNESCAEAGPFDDYDRPPYSGKLQTWYGCGEDGATVYTLAASPEGRECVVALSARVSEEADREAIEHLISTFEVDCGGVA